MRPGTLRVNAVIVDSPAIKRFIADFRDEPVVNARER